MHSYIIMYFLHWVLNYLAICKYKDTYLSLRFLRSRHLMPNPYAEKKIEIQSVLHFLETNESIFSNKIIYYLKIHT